MNKKADPTDIESSLLANDEVVEYFEIKTGKRFTGHPIDAAEAVATGKFSSDHARINRVAGKAVEPKPGTAAYAAMETRNKGKGKQAEGGEKDGQETTETSEGGSSQDPQSDSGDKILLMDNKRGALETMVVQAELATKSEAHNMNKAELVELLEKAGAV